MLCTRTLAQSHAYLTVRQANLTVERGCSHCKQCREVERSALAQVSLYNIIKTIASTYGNSTACLTTKQEACCSSPPPSQLDPWTKHAQH